MENVTGSRLGPTFAAQLNYPMKTGTVKFYNETKGFGFIVDDESKSDLFVHATGLVDRIREDDRVEFEVKEGKKGPNAVNVKLV